MALKLSVNTAVWMALKLSVNTAVFHHRVGKVGMSTLEEVFWMQ
jgi:hypothetical protein